MEYYSAFRRMGICHMLHTSLIVFQDILKEISPKDIVYDSIYMKYESFKIHGNRVVFMGWGEMGSCFNWIEFQFCLIKKLGYLLHNNVSIRNTAELYT